MPTQKIDNQLEKFAALSKIYAESLDRNIRKALVYGFQKYKKPEKYWYKPRLVIKIPYLYFGSVYSDEYDYYDELRNGLFLGWYDLKIGKKKIINKHYKEEMELYKAHNKEKGKKITFTRFNQLSQNHEKEGEMQTQTK